MSRRRETPPRQYGANRQSQGKKHNIQAVRNTTHLAHALDSARLALAPRLRPREARVAEEELPRAGRAGVGAAVHVPGRGMHRVLPAREESRDFARS